MKELCRVPSGPNSFILFQTGDEYSVAWEWDGTLSDVVIPFSAIKIIGWALYVRRFKGWAEGIFMSDFILGYFPEDLITLAVLESL